MNEANEKYIKVSGKNGEAFVCALNGIKNRFDVTDHELESCVEQDVVFRHIGIVEIDDTL